ncbi:MAG TPA: ABC transporter ATP-binding protein [Candidatus Saccharimonadales bacterium]|nr:ABC transporter ATP-binding protein [Candidatus Saccharimonadales bacterium]
MSERAAIVVRDLVRGFPGVKAVDGLTFEVNYGEIFGLVGPDGAGKTTTMRILAGVLEPDGGSAQIAGFDVVRDPERVKHEISYMSQRFGLYEDLTVDENIRFYAEVFGVKRATYEERSARLLQAADMQSFRERLAGNLSGGMKQKLGLVCALIHTPRVLLLDEPTNGVDPVSRRDFWRILYSLLAERVAILASTAYLDEAERCHRVALVHEGRILFCDQPDALKRRLDNSVIAIATTDPRGVRAAIGKAAGIRNVVLVGDGVHLLVDDAARILPVLRERMDAAKVSYTAAATASGTLEDVFVNAVERGDSKSRIEVRDER